MNQHALPRVTIFLSLVIIGLMALLVLAGSGLVGFDGSTAYADSHEVVEEAEAASDEDDGPTRAQFFMMMFGTLAIVVVVFSVIAFYVITRPNFKAHGADAIDDHESGSDRLGALLNDGKDSDKDSDSSKES